MSFSEEYLKDYKQKIHQLPLDELYEVMETIQNDSSNERINIVKRRIEELTNEPFTELSAEEINSQPESKQNKKDSATPAPKKRILAILAIIETCLITIMIVAKAKAEADPLGFLIDDAFLKSIAQHVFYESLFEILLIPSICFGAATGLYAYELYVKTQRIYSSKDYKKIVYPLCLIAMLVSLPEIPDLPPMSNEKSTIYVETVNNKEIHYRRSSANKYYLYFSSGSRLIVSSYQYDNTKIGQAYYTIYQGNIIIKALPMDRYVLTDQLYAPNKVYKE